jgi:hypothetical protein
VAGSCEGSKDPLKLCRIFDTSLSRSRTSLVTPRTSSVWYGGRCSSFWVRLACWTYKQLLVEATSFWANLLASLFPRSPYISDVFPWPIHETESHQPCCDERVEMMSRGPFWRASRAYELYPVRRSHNDILLHLRSSIPHELLSHCYNAVKRFWAYWFDLPTFLSGSPIHDSVGSSERVPAVDNSFVTTFTRSLCSPIPICPIRIPDPRLMIFLTL